MKTDVNLILKSNKQKSLKKKIIFCWHLESHWRKEQDPDPEPDTDPHHHCC
jgi:hypothetical protein